MKQADGGFKGLNWEPKVFCAFFFKKKRCLLAFFGYYSTRRFRLPAMALRLSMSMLWAGSRALRMLV